MQCKPLLVEVAGLSELEEKGLWLDSCNLLYAKWDADRTDQDMLARLELQCWYSILEAYRHGSISVEAERKLQSMMKECVAYAVENSCAGLSILWALTYTVGGWPEMFVDASTATGQDMVQLGNLVDSFRHTGSTKYNDHPLSDVFFTQHRDVEDYLEILMGTTDVIKACFPGTSALACYFRRVYLRPSAREGNAIE